MGQSPRVLSTDPNAGEPIPSGLSPMSPVSSHAQERRVLSTDPNAGEPLQVATRGASLYPHAQVGRAVIDAAKGAESGVLSTIYHGGDLIRRGLGMERIVDLPEVQQAITPPDSFAGQAGHFLEQGAEFAVPLTRLAGVMRGAPLLWRMAVEAAASAGVAGLQSGGDTGSMGVGAAFGGAAPVAGKIAGLVGGAMRRAAAGAKEGGVGGAVAGFVRRAAPEQPKAMLVQGLKPGAKNVRFEQALDRAMPEIHVTDIGKPIEGVDDLLKAVDLAKKRVFAEYEAIAGPAREMGTSIDLSDVADQMVRSIPRKLQIENPAAAAKILERAQTYRRRFSLADAERLLKETNAELEGFYNKYPMSQRKALAADPRIASKEAQASTLRDLIYRRLDDAAEGEAPRELKRRYGALMEVEDIATRRANVAKRQQPESLAEQIGTARAAGEYARGALRMARGDLAGGALDMVAGRAMRDTSRFLKEQQTTDALIRRAFAEFRGAPVAVQAPVRRQVRGLLERGAIPMGPAPDSSFVRGVRAETPVSTRKALPPARTVYETGPSPDSSFVRGVPAQYGEKWTPPPPPPPPAPTPPKPAVTTPQLPPAAPVTTARKPQYTKGGARAALDKLNAKNVKPAEVTPVAPTQPKATIKVDAPAEAAEKVEKHLDRVVDLSGAKSATEVHARVLKALADEIEPSRAVTPSVEFRPHKAYGGREGSVFVGNEKIADIDRYGTLSWAKYADWDAAGLDEAAVKKIDLDRIRDATPTEVAKFARLEVARALTQAKGSGAIRVQVPGDGTFTIQRNPEAIAETIARIKKAGPSVWDVKAPKFNVTRELKRAGK